MKFNFAFILLFISTSIGATDLTDGVNDISWTTVDSALSTGEFIGITLQNDSIYGATTYHSSDLVPTGTTLQDLAENGASTYGSSLVPGVPIGITLRDLAKNGAAANPGTALGNKESWGIVPQNAISAATDLGTALGNEESWDIILQDAISAATDLGTALGNEESWDIILQDEVSIIKGGA